MTNDNSAAPGGEGGRKPGPLPFDTTVAHQARMYDYLTQPVAVTLVAILHAIPDCDDPHAIVAQVMDAVPSGSYLALSHLGREFLPPETLRQMEDLSRGNIQQQFVYRSREQVARFFTGLELAEPGMVPIEGWRPEPGEADPAKSALWGAVARKPEHVLSAETITKALAAAYSSMLLSGAVSRPTSQT
ncbi:MAG TPA: SAM-dependent methyltransferase [Trebonia sp.]|nr:SAM-dependent methyltransferase [Trebonia sp.]